MRFRVRRLPPSVRPRIRALRSFDASVNAERDAPRNTSTDSQPGRPRPPAPQAPAPAPSTRFDCASSRTLAVAVSSHRAARVIPDSSVQARLCRFYRLPLPTKASWSGSTARSGSVEIADLISASTHTLKPNSVATARPSMAARRAGRGGSKRPDIHVCEPRNRSRHRDQTLNVARPDGLPSRDNRTI